MPFNPRGIEQSLGVTSKMAAPFHVSAPPPPGLWHPGNAVMIVCDISRKVKFSFCGAAFLCVVVKIPCSLSKKRKVGKVGFLLMITLSCHVLIVSSV